jgi:uncharacterized protein (DUF1697 family)
MSTRIALLRGINVGGNNRLPMTDLAEAIRAAGGRDVRTYIQSGNAVFEAPDALAAGSLAGEIGREVERTHGFRPHVLVRDAAYVRRIVSNNPYPEATQEPKTLHVFFLDRAPASPDIAGLEALRDGESFALDADVLYLHTPDGLGRSKLAGRTERLLGVPATARNWATVTALLELAER